MAFDLVILTLIVLSAAMSFRRGLVRESFAIIAFASGVAMAIGSLALLREPARAVLPHGWSPLLVDGCLIVAGFLSAYIASGWLGANISRLAHRIGDLGALDRLGGAVFGGLRTFLFLVFACFMVEKFVPEHYIPHSMRASYSYPYIESAAQWAHAHVPGMYQNAREIALPKQGK